MSKMSTETGLQSIASKTLNVEICSDSSSNSLLVSPNDYMSQQPHLNELDHNEDMESADEFYFESDHLCLKTNPDYRRLLKHLFILETVKMRDIRNREKLVEQINTALADPIHFVERLQNREDMGFPKRQTIPLLPVIDWSKYAINEDTASFAKRQRTRLSARVNNDVNKATRGKTCEDPKTSKLSQPWTAEEQKKLEELLIQFPHEKIETRRWEKIANALGNRTTTQVASRVQKYFIKLTRAGISVPGRMPNVSHLRKPKRHVIRQQPSTFLISQTPQVYMLDSDEDISSSYGMSLSGSIIDENSSDAKIDMSDEDASPEIRDTAKYKELMLLKKCLRERIDSHGPSHRFKDDEDLSSKSYQEGFSSGRPKQHFGFKCSRCGCDPIVGVRWHCTECCPDAIDLCEECVHCLFETGNHTSDHHLEPMNIAKARFVDQNYKFSRKSYNYLDPNYMPAI